jgi:hypothetical protein
MKPTIKIKLFSLKSNTQVKKITQIICNNFFNQAWYTFLQKIMNKKDVCHAAMS